MRTATSQRRLKQTRRALANFGVAFFSPHMIEVTPDGFVFAGPAAGPGAGARVDLINEALETLALLLVGGAA